VAGLYAVQGTLLALYAREKSGRGQFVDISMLDGQVSLLTFQGQKYLSTGAVPRRMGNQHPSICPYETFESSDGFFNIAVGNDRIWATFCATIGKNDLVSDPRFTTNPERVKNHDALMSVLNHSARRGHRTAWLRRTPTRAGRTSAATATDARDRARSFRARRASPSAARDTDGCPSGASRHRRARTTGTPSAGGGH